MATIEGTQKKLTVSGEAIESAVNSKHEHSNSAVLNKLSDKNGTLQYNGADITSGGTITNIDGGVFTEVASLTSIVAVYTQGNTVVYPSTPLNDLKSNLVVTANYSDSTTATVTDYTLSGTLTVGNSTVTVNYSEKTTTFNVTVSEETTPVPVSYESGYLDDTGRLIPSQGNYVDNKYIAVSGDTTYNIITTVGVENMKFNEYDSNKKIVKRQNGTADTNGNKTSETFTTGSTTAYVRVGFVVPQRIDGEIGLTELFSKYTCEQQ